MIVGIWLFCGLISSFVAINKGRSGCGWFGLGILLGPLGFGLALVAGPNKHALEEHALKAGDVKICPFCADVIPTGAATCPHCGQNV